MRPKLNATVTDESHWPQIDKMVFWANAEDVVTFDKLNPIVLGFIAAIVHGTKQLFGFLMLIVARRAIWPRIATMKMVETDGAFFIAENLGSKRVSEQKWNGLVHTR